MEKVAAIQDGKRFRVYTDAQHFGDADYLIDEVTAPKRCSDADSAFAWFMFTLAPARGWEVEVAK